MKLNHNKTTIWLYQRVLMLSILTLIKYARKVRTSYLALKTLFTMDTTLIYLEKKKHVNTMTLTFQVIINRKHLNNCKLKW